MKAPQPPSNPIGDQPAFILRGQAAAKAIAKELRAERKRWNLPLLSCKDGKIVATKPWGNGVSVQILTKSILLSGGRGAGKSLEWREGDHGLGWFLASGCGEGNEEVEGGKDRFRDEFAHRSIQCMDHGVVLIGGIESLQILGLGLDRSVGSGDREIEEKGRVLVGVHITGGGVAEPVGEVAVELYLLSVVLNGLLGAGFIVGFFVIPVRTMPLTQAPELVEAALGGIP